MYKIIVILSLIGHTANAATTKIIPLKVFTFSKPKQTEDKIKQVLTLPDVLWDIIFSYNKTESTSWTETSNMQDTSWFNAPCYESLIYLSSHQVAAGTNNGDVEIFNPLRKERVHRTPRRFLNDDAVESLVHNKESGEMIGGCRNGRINIWDSSSYKHLHTIKEHNSCVKYLSLVRPNFLVSATLEGNMRFWHIKERRCVAVVPSASHHIAGLAPLTADSFVTIQDKYNVVLWDVNQQAASQKQSLNCLNREWPLHQLAVFNSHVFACLQGKHVMMYDARSIEPTGKYAHHNLDLKMLIAHHDALIVRSAGTINIYDIRAAQKPLQKISVTENDTWSMCLASNPDSSAFAASIYPSAVKTWDLCSGSAAENEQL